MRKLIKKIEPLLKSLSYAEVWMLDNDLRIVISFCDDMRILSIQSKTGDVADQIYEILIQDDRFKSIKLDTGSCYFIEFDKSLLDYFFEAAELIDVKNLKEGKRY